MQTTVYDVLILLRWLLPKKDYLYQQQSLKQWFENEKERFFYINTRVTLQKLEIAAFLKTYSKNIENTKDFKKQKAIADLNRICILPQVTLFKDKHKLYLETRLRITGKDLRKIYTDFNRTRIWDKNNEILLNIHTDHEYSAQAVYILKRMNATPSEAIRILFELQILTKLINTDNHE